METDLKNPMTRTKGILGVSIAAVFVFAMMTNPVFAVSSNLLIESVDGFSMTTKGPNPGVEENHDIVVYAFFTNIGGKTVNSFVAYVAATHGGFSDDPEQDEDIRALHAHKVELNKDTLCVQDISESPDVSVSKSTISIQDAKGKVGAWVIAGYDITEDGYAQPKYMTLGPKPFPIFSSNPRGK